MWYIGDKKRPQLGAVSGPEGWATKEECETEIEAVKIVVVQIGRRNLRNAVELSGGKTDSALVAFEAEELERTLTHIPNLIPIEVK